MKNESLQTPQTLGVSSRHSKACISLQHLMQLSAFVAIFCSYDTFCAPSPTTHISKSLFYLTGYKSDNFSVRYRKNYMQNNAFPIHSYFSTVLSQFVCFYALWKLQKEINIYCKLCSANLLLCCVALVNFSKETLTSFYQATVPMF